MSRMPRWSVVAFLARDPRRQSGRQMLVEQAIAIDPNDAQAFALSAVSHTFGAHMGWEDAATASPIARQAALSAVRADGADPWAHLALACAYAYMGMIESLTAFEAALRLNPNFSLAQGYYGLALSWVRRSRDGAEAVSRLEGLRRAGLD
jgi:tetratricopeptide (TPR) repeat protein